MGYPFNKLAFGIDGEYITTVVEIPEGSTLKIEWRRHEEYFALDRVDPKIFSKPTNYGFIPQTLDEDGDELDVLVRAVQRRVGGDRGDAQPRDRGEAREDPREPVLLDLEARRKSFPRSASSPRPSHAPLLPP